MGSWQIRGAEDEKYSAKFRLSMYVFNHLYKKYGAALEKDNIGIQIHIPGKKILGILLHWHAAGGSYEKTADLYQLGHSTVCSILHEAIGVLVECRVPDVIVFPEDPELGRVINDFQSLCHLPQCCSAADGTFVKTETGPVW